MPLPKVSVVGAGYVGELATQTLVGREVAHVALFDIIEDLPEGKALDQFETAPIFHGTDARVTGVSVNKDGDGHEYAALAESRVVIITSGLPRKPGMSRDDLLKINASIVGGVIEHVKHHAPDAVIIMITNPVDSMTHLAALKTGWPRERVIGQAGVLDSARMAAFIAEALNCSVKDVSPMVMGGHGDTMVPLPRYTSVSGIPVTDLLPPEKLAAIADRTRKGGGEIVNLFRNTGGRLGSAYHAPGVAAAAMAESIVRDQKRIMPACVLSQGEYGLNDVVVGMPVVLGEGGVARVIELRLNDAERQLLEASAAHVDANTKAMKALLGL